MKDTLEYAGFFDGIGGFSLAAEKMGWNVNFHSEIDPFCDRILKYYWKNAINYGDITKADLSFWRGRIDVLAGGFPCQPFSGAGNRKGTLDHRYLWPEMLKGIDIVRPTWVVGENVAGIFSMEDKSGVWKEVFFKVDGRNVARLQEVDQYNAVYTRQKKMLLDSISQDLEKIGYTVQIFSVPAAAVGAVHNRERVWIVAHRQGERGEIWRPNGIWKTENKTFGKDLQFKSFGFGKERTPSNTNGPIKECGPGIHIEEKGEVRRSKKGDVPGKLCGNGNVSATGNEQLQGSKHKGSLDKKRKIEKNSGQFSRSICNLWEEYPTQSPVCGRDDGIPRELDSITFPKWRNESIKAYGNAIVPQVAYQLFKTIEKYEEMY